jgi:hypothetical protein
MNAIEKAPRTPFVPRTKTPATCGRIVLVHGLGLSTRHTRPAIVIQPGTEPDSVLVQPFGVTDSRLRSVYVYDPAPAGDGLENPNGERVWAEWMPYQAKQHEHQRNAAAAEGDSRSHHGLHPTPTPAQFAEAGRGVRTIGAQHGHEQRKPQAESFDLEAAAKKLFEMSRSNRVGMWERVPESIREEFRMIADLNHMTGQVGRLVSAGGAVTPAAVLSRRRPCPARTWKTIICGSSSSKGSGSSHPWSAGMSRAFPEGCT